LAALAAKIFHPFSTASVFERNRLLGEERWKFPAPTRSSRDAGIPQGVMDNLSRFPAAWSVQEDEHDFQVKDASGCLIVAVPHR
jgi:hypothetical protein